MAYVIRFSGKDKKTNCEACVKEIQQWAPGSRFRLSPFGKEDPITVFHNTRSSRIELRNIRLAKNKHYCGNHAGPCRARGGTHRKAAFLEGNDWVEFNDCINDILDRLNLAADVFTSACEVRRGRMRRRVYDGVDGGEFHKKGHADDYDDCCGNQTPASRSWSPPGTPGGVDFDDHED